MKLVHLSNWSDHRKNYPQATLEDYSDHLMEVAIKCLRNIRNPNMKKKLELSILMYQRAKQEFSNKEEEKGKEENGKVD